MRIIKTVKGNMFLSKHFAWYPKKIGSYWVWLETYWQTFGILMYYDEVLLLTNEECMMGLLNGTIKEVLE